MAKKKSKKRKKYPIGKVVRRKNGYFKKVAKGKWRKCNSQGKIKRKK